MPDHPAPLIRTRVLVLTGPPPEEEVLGRIAAIRGVSAVRGLGQKRRIALSYDLQVVTLAELEPLLAAAGLVLSRSRLARGLRAWASFQDDNLRAQSRIRHHCCCDPGRPSR